MSTTTKSPSIIIVPGSFCYPGFYDPIVNPIRSQGYDIHALKLPSASKGEVEAPPTMAEDAEFVNKAIAKMADQGKDVLVIAHSYGGVVMTEAMKGLGKDERSKQGKKGGIVRLAYMTAAAPPVGGTLGAELAPMGTTNTEMMKVEDGWLVIDPETAGAISFSELPKEEQVVWGRKFKNQSAISFMGEVTYAGYKDFPVSYLVCEKDICISPEVQRHQIATIESVSGNKVDVSSIPADHCPVVSATDSVVNWVIKVAEKAAA